MPSVVAGTPNFYQISTDELVADTPAITVGVGQTIKDTIPDRLTNYLGATQPVDGVMFYISESLAPGADNSGAGVWRYTVDPAQNLDEWIKIIEPGAQGLQKIATHADLGNIQSPENGDLVQTLDTHTLYVYVDETVTPPGGGATVQVQEWREFMPLHPQSNILMGLEYDPELPLGDRMQWQDDRTRMEVVQDKADLSDRTLLPVSHLTLGKLVFVITDSMLYELTTDPSVLTDTIKDWKPMASGLTYVGRVGNLPNPMTTTILEGQTFVVRMDFAGEPLYRLVSFDANMAPRVGAPVAQLTATGLAVPATPGQGPKYNVDFVFPAGAALNQDATLTFDVEVQQGASPGVYQLAVDVFRGQDLPTILSQVAAQWPPGQLGQILQASADSLMFTGDAGSGSQVVFTGTRLVSIINSLAEATAFLSGSVRAGDYAVNQSGGDITLPGNVVLPDNHAVGVRSVIPLEFMVSDDPVVLAPAPPTVITGTTFKTALRTAGDLQIARVMLGRFPQGTYFINASGGDVTISEGTVPDDTAIISDGAGHVVIADSPTQAGPIPLVQVSPVRDLGDVSTDPLNNIFQLTAQQEGDWFQATADITLPHGSNVPTMLYGFPVKAGDWFLYTHDVGLGYNGWAYFPASKSVTLAAAPKTGFGAMTGTGNTFESLFKTGGAAGYNLAPGDWIEVRTNGTLPAGPESGGVAGEQVAAGDMLVVLSTSPIEYHIEPGGANANLGGTTITSNAFAPGDPTATVAAHGQPSPPGTAPEHVVPGPGFAPANDPEFSEITVLPSVVHSFSMSKVANSQPQALAAGGWRYLNRHVWNKDSRIEADQHTDQQDGDLQITHENGHQEIKAWNAQSNQWDLIYSRDEINRAIAALSLFEGTVQQVGGTGIGAVELSALPDLDALSAQGDLSFVSHYWTWIGDPNFDVVAGTPRIANDLQGAVLNPGDWLQVSNAGTAQNPDLRWSWVGGDLLAKSRADRLFGLQPWTGGGWEPGALVVFQGDVYRARQAVTSQDPSPSPTPNQVSITLSGIVTHDLDGSQMSELPPGPADGDVEKATAAGRINNLQVPFTGLTYAADDYLVYSSDPAFAGQGTTHGGFRYDGGWIYVGQVAGSLPDPFDLATSVPNTPWERIDISGGLKVAQTDGDLPPTAPPGQVWIVLSSARAGGSQGLFAYDIGGQNWAELGGGKAIPLDLNNGAVVYPRVIYLDAEVPENLADASVPQPSITGDMLVTKIAAGHPLIVAVSKDGQTWARYHPDRLTFDTDGANRPAKADYPMQKNVAISGGTAKITHIADRSRNWIEVPQPAPPVLVAEDAQERHATTSEMCRIPGQMSGMAKVDANSGLYIGLYSSQDNGQVYEMQLHHRLMIDNVYHAINTRKTATVSNNMAWFDVAWDQGNNQAYGSHVSVAHWSIAAAKFNNLLAFWGEFSYSRRLGFSASTLIVHGYIAYGSSQAPRATLIQFGLDSGAGEVTTFSRLLPTF